MVGDINLFNSPDVTIAEFPKVFDERSNYYYFNVHGSDMDKHWFGKEQLRVVYRLSVLSILESQVCQMF